MERQAQISQWLFEAEHDGLKDFAKFFIEKGANVKKMNLQDRLNQWLSEAVSSNLSDFVKFFHGKGAEVNARNENRKTALTQSPNLEMTKFLVDSGANVNVSNCDGETPLMMAVKSFDVKMVEFLVDSGANVNAKDKDGKTALYFATSYRYAFTYGACEKIAEILLAKGADVNVVCGGQVLLTTPILENHQAMVALLLDNGVNTGLVDSATNLTALSLAKSCGNRKKIVKIFRTHGIKK